MKISIECFGVLIRNPQAHVPAFTDRYLPAVNSLVLPKVERADYNGVFAPNSKYRALVTPAKRGKSKKAITAETRQNQTPAERRASMTWAQRLKRVFDIDVETCSECGGDVHIIASIEDPMVIRKILAHLDGKAFSATTGLLPDCRAPPSPPLGLSV